MCLLFQAIADSSRHLGMIKDLGKLWGHLKEGYGRLIAFYAKLIIQKITFHRKVLCTSDSAMLNFLYWAKLDLLLYA